MPLSSDNTSTTFLHNYFERGLKNKNQPISHSIIFYGSDLKAQYDFALDIARKMNCSLGGDNNCSCQSCSWVKKNEHPAIMTISRFDNKPESDSSKTVISIAQAQMIKSMLMNSSDFHRVFIFCDKDADGNICGINQDNFQEETANALLKTIEEPPAHTTFFFLTRDKNDLISTIISRSQSFFVPSETITEKDFSSIQNIFSEYWTFERMSAFDKAEELFALTKEMPAIKVLDSLQNYMLFCLKNNLNNHQTMHFFIKNIETVELAKKQIEASVSPQSVFENLCLDLIK